MKRYPECRYLFGPVSLSRELPQAARDLIVFHYRNHYGAACLAHARRPYVPSESRDVHAQLTGDHCAADFVRLKHLLAHMGCSVPTLYKQYTEIAESDGVRFLDFGIVMLPLLCGVLSSLLTRPFCAVPRTSVSRIA